MTEPTRLRLANGWTVSIAPDRQARSWYTVTAWPSADDRLPVPDACCHTFDAPAGGNRQDVPIFHFFDLLPLLREAAALEPPR